MFSKWFGMPTLHGGLEMCVVSVSSEGMSRCFPCLLFWACFDRSWLTSWSNTKRKNAFAEKIQQYCWGVRHCLDCGCTSPFLQYLLLTMNLADCLYLIRHWQQCVRFKTAGLLGHSFPEVLNCWITVHIIQGASIILLNTMYLLSHVWVGGLLTYHNVDIVGSDEYTIEGFQSLATCADPPTGVSPVKC